MKRDSNIVACVDASTGGPPPTLRTLGVARVVGRTVESWCGHYGSYGMGGPGFFGLELQPTATAPREHLVLTLWGAGDWLLYDGRWISAHPNQYDVQRPWTSDFGGDDSWDELTGVLSGGALESIEHGPRGVAISIQVAGQLRSLEVPEDTSRLSRFGGSMEPRRWNPNEHPLDAWVVCAGDLTV